MEYIHGDITEETSGLIIQGVNCRGVMGAGVALAIKTKWPAVYEAYLRHPQGRDALGSVQYVVINDKLTIANCWTQEFYGNDGKVYADIHALYKCVLTAFAFCEYHEVELKTPKIAAGLAGLDWDKDVVPVFKLGQSIYPSVNVKVFVI